MNTEFAKQHSSKFSVMSLLSPLLLLGALTVFSYVRVPILAEAQTMAGESSTASALHDPRFTRTWAITLRNQYRAANTYCQALRRPQPLFQRQSLEIRYDNAAREYNRMAREAPPAAFQVLSQPQTLPIL